MTNLPDSPREGEKFELTLDGDAIDPLAMVRNDGYTGDWKFHGPKVVGKQTRKFKLLRAGYQLNLDGVKTKLGSLAEGEWREAFQRKFRPAPGVLVGFGGSAWAAPGGGRYFPYLYERGGVWYPGFGYALGALDEHWLWFVPSRLLESSNSLSLESLNPLILELLERVKRIEQWLVLFISEMGTSPCRA